MMTIYAMPKASAEMPPARYNQLPSRSIALSMIFCEISSRDIVHAQNRPGTNKRMAPANGERWNLGSILGQRSGGRQNAQTSPEEETAQTCSSTAGSGTSK